MAAEPRKSGDEGSCSTGGVRFAGTQREDAVADTLYHRSQRCGAEQGTGGRPLKEVNTMTDEEIYEMYCGDVDDMPADDALLED